MTSVEPAAARAMTVRKHIRAIALLPAMNTIAIPAAILLMSDPRAVLETPLDTSGLLRLTFALGLVSAGVLLVQHCIRLFVRHGRGTLAPWDPTQALVTAGAYRYSRNPMKAGLFLILLGEALLAQSLPLLAWFGAFALVNAVYIRVHEEPGLEARFGERYREYCVLVPRWWPRLRPVVARYFA